MLFSMAIEIELKAWLETPEKTRRLLASFACLSCAFDKRDAYWYPRSGFFPQIPPSGIRIRRECDTVDGGVTTQTIFVTYKTKETRPVHAAEAKNIEVNHEHEFAVADPGGIEELLTVLGFEPGIVKHKRGEAWHYEDITVELIHVERLGDFVELEILADNDAPDTVAAARSRLLALLEKLDVPKDKIESRYYTEMLTKERQK
jgi:adenylate cyclase class 2